MGIVLDIVLTEQKPCTNKAARDVERLKDLVEEIFLTGVRFYSWGKNGTSSVKCPDILDSCSVGASQGLIRPLQATASLQAT